MVVDRTGSSPLRPSFERKARLRLDRAYDTNGRLTRDGVDQIIRAVSDVLRVMPQDIELVAFATSSIRDAANSSQAIRHIAQQTGVHLATFAGEREAHLSYVAARHWFGHAAGPLTVLDVGGGTAEIAAGSGTRPHAAISLPFGARTLTQSGVDNTMPLADIRAQTAENVRVALSGTDVSGTAIGCSKVMQQLARLAGARPQREGPFVARHLRLTDLRKWIPRLADLTAAERAELPGISRHRARQSLAGAVVAEAMLVATGHDSAQICPWSSTEGLLLELLGHQDAGAPLASVRDRRRFAS
ncbi:Ppx/GppA phosphatase family protein [Kibdelosporangium phytohabitans]|nr:exopolyphosphatase [Kibdelosporangium phytohabitans]MBE1469214.1 exopolyphosphatase/guanosine-5'-triphosphate,3'-diphosphate pyrophosphatase [Kibdelosporangium phytohabitans]